MSHSSNTECGTFRDDWEAFKEATGDADWDTYQEPLWDTVARAPLFEPWDTPTKPAVKRRKRRALSVATALKRAKELGVDVVIGPDGTATFKTSTTIIPDVQNHFVNPWDEVLSHGPH